MAAAQQFRMRPGSRTIVPGVEDNWEVFTRWRNDTGIPITRFETTWTVPPVPVSPFGIQKNPVLIFLFNGLSTEKPKEQVADRIIQPVLQYGLNGDAATGGGGYFWSIASWWAGSQTDQFMKRPDKVAVRVEPGRVLKGIMTQTQEIDGTFTLTSEFDGFAETKLIVPKVTEAKYLDLALEVTNPEHDTFPIPQKYPPVFCTSMRSINIAPAGLCTKLNFKVPWVIKGGVNECGEHALIQSDDTNSGIVDLCYGMVAPASIKGISTVDKSYDLFIAGPDGHVRHKSAQDDKWHDLGPLWLSALDVVSRSPQTYDVFALGALGIVQWGRYDGKAWHSLKDPSLGNSIKGPVAAAASGTDKIEVFGIGWGKAEGEGNDGRLQYKKFEKDAWDFAWVQRNDGNRTFMSSPIAYVSKAGQVEVFAIETSRKEDGGQLCQRTYTKDNVTDWQPLGQALTLPAFVVLDNDNSYLFAILAEGGRRYIQYKERPDGEDWSDWTSLGGWQADNTRPWAGAPVAVARPKARIDVFALGKDNQIYHKAFRAEAWLKDWTLVGYKGDIKSNPAVTAISGTDDVLIVALDVQNQVVQTTLTGDNFSNSWQVLGKI